MTDLATRLGLLPDRPPRVVAVGAHADDIEIGAAGTVIRLLAERPDADIRFVVLSATATRRDEARASAAALSPNRSIEATVLDGRDGHLPFADASRIKDALASAVREPPDLVLVHRGDDAHQDHRFAAELAWQLFRWSTILEYEIPKWDGDGGRANVYVRLEEGEADRKVSHLLAHFRSQHAHEWYAEETFRAVLRLRGIESRAASGLAEAFVARKLVL